MPEPAPATIEEYIGALAPEKQGPMRELRSAIRAGAPEAIEAISYGMPALRVDGRFLVSYAAFKHHYSVFPASDGVIIGLGDEIAPHVAGRGTLRFPASRPIPADLITRVVRIRLAEHGPAASGATRQPPVPTGENDG